MKILFCILGRSATGKDTLTNEVCKKLHMDKVISHTTRSPREGEKEGQNYYFSSDKDFCKTDKANLCAYTKIEQYQYWTTFDEVQNKDFYIIDPEGLRFLQRSVQDKDIRLVTIYITAPQLDRDKRAVLRDKNSIVKYKAKCAAENNQFALYEQSKEYDYCIHNRHFGVALEQLITIITKEKENFYAI